MVDFVCSLFMIPGDQNGGDGACHTSRRVRGGEGKKRAAESRLATMNVCGGMENKLDEVCMMMKERNLDVLCLTETKKKGVSTSTHGTLTALWSGVSDDEHGCQGVGIVLTDRMAECMQEHECVSPRLLWVRLKVGLIRLFVVGVYAPDTSKKCSVEHQTFLEFGEIGSGEIREN